MDGQTTGTNEAMGNQAQADPWAAAFAALEPKGEEAAQAAADGGEASGIPVSDAGSPDGQDASDDQGGQGGADASAVGGLGDDAGSDNREGGGDIGGAFGEFGEFDEESLKEYEEKLNSDIRTQAINDIAEEFLKRGIRNKDGMLGATLEDEDICKRDEDGVPRFFNPETGREFTGDNPRRQAQEWVDDYNRELARLFNTACSQYEEHLKNEAAPQLAVRKFAPKYNKLDDIRRGMLDNVIEGYEIKDNDGKIIGYSCDLDKALDLVDRQIAMIQNYAKAKQQTPPEQPSSPVLDMKTSSGGVQSGDMRKPESLSDALEMLQDKLIESRK